MTNKSDIKVYLYPRFHSIS